MFRFVTLTLIPLLMAGLSLPAMAAPPEINMTTTFASLMLVVMLILVLAVIVKKMRLPNLQGDSSLKVIKQIPVGQKERIVLVQVGDEQLLVGVTQHNISLLNKLDTPLAEPEMERPDFASQLGKLLKNDMNKQ